MISVPKSKKVSLDNLRPISLNKLPARLLEQYMLEKIRLLIMQQINYTLLTKLTNFLCASKSGYYVLDKLDACSSLLLLSYKLLVRYFQKPHCWIIRKEKNTEIPTHESPLTALLYRWISIRFRAADSHLSVYPCPITFQSYRDQI